MKVLAAMSGGVDSSVAAALLLDDGHQVVGATMKLWGGPSDQGCCSVADVDDARRVCHQLGVDHHVFNFTEDFDSHVVAPYLDAHVQGRTPNPCIECNRHLKFDRFLVRARQLGFDAVATGHHARVTRADNGTYELRRGADAAKDQSYVLHMLDQDALARTLLPVGAMTKAEVRARAESLGLRTAAKPDSQDTCFLPQTGGRATFLGARIPLRPGRVVDTTGQPVGAVDAVELVTIGQRRGLGVSGTTAAYALDVDTEAGVVTVGTREQLVRPALPITQLTWVAETVAPGTSVLVQTSAHGEAKRATFTGDAVEWQAPQPRVAPGQSVVLYASDNDAVLGGGLAR